MLKEISSLVPFGIYAVEKGNKIEMLNCKCKSRTQLKKEIRDWKREGYKVYYNGL